MQQIISRIVIPEEVDKYKLIYKGKNGEVRRFSRDEVLKIISEEILKISLRISPYSRSIIERNVLQSNNFEYPEEFYLPTNAIYTENGFIGYTQEYFNGIDIIDYYRQMLKGCGTYTFDGLLEPYKKLNSALKNTPHTVCPDLASGGNILIDYNDNIAITDFAGFQIGNNLSTDISCYLISEYRHIQDQVQDNLEHTKYMNGELFTKELDKRTILLMLIRDVFSLSLPALELNNNIFPFEIRKRQLLLLKLKKQLLKEYISGKTKEETKKDRKEFKELKNQRKKTDYDEFKRVLNFVGIENNSHLMNAILKMSDDEAENEWIDNVLDELESNYILENKGRVRRLIKK